MLTCRIVTTGAVLLTMAASAAAQDAAGTAAPGKPLSLLQMLLHPAKAEPHAKARHKIHTRFAHRRARATTRVAAAAEQAAPPPAANVTDTPAADIWQTPDQNIDANAPAVPYADTAAAPSTPPASQALTEMVVGGHTVQIASPDNVNALDLAADAPHDIAASPGDRSDKAMASVALAQRDEGQSWLSELAATLGGALAAGSVGWLLIGSSAQRRYS